MAKKLKSQKKESKKVHFVVARSDDGTIQITFTIPYDDIRKYQDEAALEIGKDLEIPGFRKGKAPLDLLLERIPQNDLLEKTLSKILPKLFSQAIEENNIKPIVFPKFELIKAKEGEDWEIRAETAELPEFELGDYKKTILGVSRAKSIWTPNSRKDKSDQPQSRVDKEQEVIKTLLETIKVRVPKILIDEEVNSRLSRLLEQIDRLGISLDSYLASIKKTATQLREEYESQAKDAIALDLILTRIAQKENLKVDDGEIDAAIQASSADSKLAQEIDTPEKRRLIETILLKRKALNFLTSLA